MSNQGWQNEPSEDDTDEHQQLDLNQALVRIASGEEWGTSSSEWGSSPEHSEREETPEGEAQFDTNLPTAHKYLGRLDNISGYTLFDDGEQLTLLAIHTNTLVFPGFTLPLVMNSQIEQSVMQEFIGRRNIFALVCADVMGTYIYKYGVTMEVFESFSKRGTLYLKARGRQRCKIVQGSEIRHLGGRLQQITVRVLAEPDVTSPIANTQLLTLKTRRACPTGSYESMMRHYRHRRYHLAQYPNASWVYDHNEVCYYVKLIVEHLTRFYIKENIPTSPIVLSYWFIQNFQLAHEERLHLMKLDTTLERLRLEYRFLQVERLICCGVCKAEITSQSNVFAMSKDGVQSNYCNPGGHVYETVTVSEATNCNAVGAPSKEFSWFPGYWWTVLQCHRCRGHIGWEFTSKHLQPHAFYGLAKSGLDIKIVQDGADHGNT